MTGAMLSVLQHARGVDEYGRGRRYRNHFVTGPGLGNTDYDACRACVDAGLMIERTASQLSGGEPIFIVTDAGDRFINECSPAPPPAVKCTRSQRRYDTFLREDSGLKFGDWLRSRPAS